MVFRLFQIVLTILLLIYYSTILIDVFTNGKYGLTGHNLNDSHIWIPFYVWLAPKKKRK